MSELSAHARETTLSRIRQAEYITEQLRTGSIPTGHAVWNGRDPGGAAPEASDVPAELDIR